MVVLVARYITQRGEGDTVEAALREMAVHVRDLEPDCLIYEVNRSPENPDEFLLYERYRDDTAFEAHRTTVHFRAIVEGRILPLLAQRDRSVYTNVIS